MAAAVSSVMGLNCYHQAPPSLLLIPEIIGYTHSTAMPIKLLLFSTRRQPSPSSLSLSLSLSFVLLDQNAVPLRFI